VNKTAWIIFSALVVGIFAFLIVFSSGTKIDVSKINTSLIQTATAQDGNIADHVFGKVGSKVTLIEYGDFQCPACGSVHTRVKPLIELYHEQLQFVFRNFPLTTLHANGKAAAGAVEAAGLQGKYWEMHNKIYESQSEWSNLIGSERNDYFAKLATDFKLDITKFNTAIGSETVLQKINFDLSLGKKDNVQGTPSFYLNGKSIDQKIWGDDTKLKDAINTELTKAGIELPPK